MKKSSKPFRAVYNSSCWGGDMIFEGDEIVMADGVAYHTECAEEDNYEIPNEGEEKNEDDFFG